MKLLENELIKLKYQPTLNILAVKWPDELRVESPEFLETIITLFAIIHDRKVAHLIIDSGIPAGGVLTEQVINYMIQNIPNIPLKKIALLESTDYHWDNNLYQLLTLIISTHQLPVAVELVKSRAAARQWFSPLLQVKTVFPAV